MKFLLITILLAGLALYACKNNESKQESPWQLVWGDEFNYSGLPDNSKWNYDTGGHGWGNNELQFYNANRMENARVEDSQLVIEARKENWQGSSYTSARMVTKGKAEWQYGRIEVKARIPSGLGTWPAIWMLGANDPLAWPDDGEIDIMEHVGHNQGYVHGSIHCKKYNHVIGTQKTDTVYVPDCSQAYHVYSTEWDKDSVRVGIDNNIYFRFANDHTGYDAWPFDNKMYLLLNIAVGGNWGGQKGIDSTIYPRRMEIDYVRVYKKKPAK